MFHSFLLVCDCGLYSTVYRVHHQPPEPINSLAAQDLPLVMWQPASQRPSEKTGEQERWRRIILVLVCLRYWRADCLIINTSWAPQSSPGGHMDWGRQSPASWRTVLLLPPVPPVSTTSTLHTTSWTDSQNCGGINSSFNSLVLTGEGLRLARDLSSVLYSRISHKM